MKNRKGFTIVELVIVIAVIAILAAVLIPTFSSVIGKANASSAQQTAMNSLKSGLMMTNTATLPANTFILIDSDKTASTNPDYGYVYDGNALGEPVSLYDENKAFKTTTYITGTVNANTILVTDKFCTATATGNTATVDSVDEVLLNMLKVATGKSTLTNANVTAEAKDGVVTKIIVTYEPAVGDDPTDASYVPAKTFTVFTSVDLPTNVIVFVPMG